ncbi:helix-turn-helix domain-containing protein [Geodermatophilus sp. SYSU D00867]
MNHDQRAGAAPVLLTLDEAAAFLRTPAGTLRYWRHLGVGPEGFRLGRRVMYRLEDLARWVAERQDADLTRRDVSTSPRRRTS